MEQFQYLRDKAFEKIKVADHMLFMTYPLVKDPKLLLSVAENVYAALDFAIAALLHHELTFKRIPPFQDSFNNRFHIFREKVAPSYNLSENYAKLITNVKSLLSEHKASPVVFSKKDKFVMLSKDFKVKSLDANIVKKYILEAKVMIRAINEVVSRHERIFV